MNLVIGIVLLSFVGSALSADCLCGQEVVRKRIINGRVAEKGRFPWMTSVIVTKPVQTPDGHPFSLCGGSIINDRYILTAAHCMDKQGLTPENVRITIGAHTKSDRFRMAPLPVASFKVHEKWTGASSDGNDIAIIRLKKPLKFDGMHIAPVCLAGFTTRDDLFITGWGNQNDGSDIVSAKELFYGDLKQNPDSKCHRFFKHYRGNATQVCVGLETGTCKGDSGSPVSVRKNGHVYQYGIVSFGASGCGFDARLNMKDLESIPPSVSERVIHHKDWIQKNTADAVYCRSGVEELLF